MGGERVKMNDWCHYTGYLFAGKDNRRFSTGKELTLFCSRPNLQVQTIRGSALF